ncbi:unnamed protein product [Dibothriocephalus latus]|uniref:Uncharacterized protein n=1 Tax=Dibothriocephalus latus TaxID=60516 RepID=A0A3P7P939_DIBLA|nr:unnamed protein product [Dibothriocephalus latus]
MGLKIETDKASLMVLETRKLLGILFEMPQRDRRIPDLEAQLRQSTYVVDENTDERQPISADNKHILSESRLEDIKVRACFVSPAERAALWNNWRCLTKEGTEPHDNIPVPEFAEESFAYPIGDEGGQ